MKRRKFIKKGAHTGLAMGMGSLIPMNLLSNTSSEPMDERIYLEEILYTEKEVDEWLAGKAFPFSKYHAEFGWLLNNGHYQDGVDDTYSTYTYEGTDGERIMSNYSEKPCRINTYGDSFTQCHQVSDHETWQEVLAAHIQEPVRNYGIGGWSVYQAYLRMLKEETRKPAEYIIFNIYEDDHERNLDSWRNIRVKKHPAHIEATLPHVKVDLKKKTITEFGNPCPTPESVYNLCDIDKTYKLFRDDFVLKIMLAHRNSEMANDARAYESLKELIKTHGIETNLDSSATLDSKADEIHRRAAIFSTTKIVEKIEDFARSGNKKVLYVLSFPGSAVAEYISNGKRYDRDFIPFLEERELPYIDLLEEHAKDYQKYNLSIEDYIDKYFIGHYNPLGNFFCANALRKRMVDMLEPKPFPYLKPKDQ